VMLRQATILFLAISIPSASLACSPGSLPPWVEAVAGNQRIKTYPDCSFDGAGRSISAVGHGEPSLDIGSGMISQVVSFGEHFCSVDEYVLVADCSTGKALLILGLPDPMEEEYGAIHSAGLLLKAAGPFPDKKGGSLGAVAAKARRLGTPVTEDAKGFVASLRRKDRFDPFCGCKLSYPDSAGSQN